MPNTPSPTSPLWLWTARAAWVLLPVATGTAIGDALASWPTGPQRLAAALCWIAWAAGLFALLAPRPWGTTLLRVVAPTGVAVLVASISSTTAGNAVLSCSAAFVAAALALSAAPTSAAANSLAYGDEVRFPLRVPTPLLFGPVPVAIALVALGAITGPLFLADANLVVGVPLTLFGGALAVVLTRSLHSLARRWLVFVPAGIALVDPLTLADPVLMQREIITGLRRVAATPRPADDLDLRLGSFAGGVEISLGEPVAFGRRRGRADAQLLEPEIVVVATVQTPALVAVASARQRRA